MIDPAGWHGIDQLGYWFFYPTLILVTIVNADFTGLQLDAMMLALAITVPRCLYSCCHCGRFCARPVLPERPNSRRFSKHRSAGTVSWRWPLPKNCFRPPEWLSSRW
ncbi:hypothetical protein [Mesorhizobium sp.]|uniref:hypothetical protein n=1 Tax=Mesorhizobium sp. TaxID=1871066 RepID=UPI00345D356B